MIRRLLMLFLIVASPLAAQTGLPPFASFQNGGLDTVNRQNLNVNFSIPIVSVPGRGKSFSFRLVYDSLVWQKSGNYWLPVVDENGNPTWGWKKDVPVGKMLNDSMVMTCIWYTEDYIQMIEYAVRSYNYRFVDAAGTVHGFDIDFYSEATTCGYSPTSPSPSYAGDNSGLFLDLNQGYQVTIPDGASFTGTLFKDTNGNYLSLTQVSSTETKWTDTLGRTVLRIIKSTNCSYGGTTYPECVAYKTRSASNVEQTATLYLNSFHVKTAFGCTSEVNYNLAGKLLPEKLVLPNGQSYIFEYEPTPNDPSKTTGRLGQVTLPTGGKYLYEYVGSTRGINCSDDTIHSLDRTITESGTTGPKWEFRRTQNGTNWDTKIKNPIGDESVFTFNSSQQLTTTKIFQGLATGTPLRTVHTTWAVNGTPASSATILEESNQHIKVSTTFDSFGNLTEFKEYDMNVGGPGAVARRTKIDYLHSDTSVPNYQNYLNANILNRPTKQQVFQGSTVQAGVQFVYDEGALTQTSSVPQHDYSSHSYTNTLRGNVTSLKRWNGATFVTAATSTYNDLGNLLTSADAGGHATTFSYTDSWQDALCGTATLSNTQAYPYEVTNPLGHRTRFEYFSCTGAVQSVKDQNDLLAVPPRAGTVFAYDILGRTTEGTLPDGAYVSLDYNDTARVITRSQKRGPTAADNLWILSVTEFDPLGRVKLVKQCEDGTSACASSIKTDTTYDGLGRVATVSNPYRAPTGEPTNGVTAYEYDALGRVTKVIPPDGSSASNFSSIAYYGSMTTVTDPAGKTRRSWVDGLGRMVQVNEPAGNPPSLNTPAATKYFYDIQNNLVCVLQLGGDLDAPYGCDDPIVAQKPHWRKRQFTYNALSQLLTSATPEAGAVSNVYNSEGLLLTTTSPKQNQTNAAVTVTTTFTYDALHRITSKSFNDGATPSHGFAYDDPNAWGRSLANTMGRIVVNWTGDGQGEVFSYDAMGRVIRDEQCIVPGLGGCVVVQAEYNMDGSAKSLSYPSGRKVTYGYNTAAQLDKVTFASFGTTQVNYDYVSSISYGPIGASQVQFNNGLYEVRAFNKRGQLCRLALLTASGSAGCPETSGTPANNVLDFAYTYGISSANNGTILSWAGAGNQSFARAFQYDELNRLKQMDQPAGTPAMKWQYDVWGNRTKQEVVGVNTQTWGYSVKNQINDTGFAHDAAGNMTAQLGGPTFQWDAENRLKTISSNGPAYTFDAAGRRVAKSAGGAMTAYIYFGTQAIAERSSGAWTDYILAGGRVIASAPGTASSTGTKYFHADHLGSTRLLSDTSGAPISGANYDYKPFGELSTSPPAPGTFLFTGLERDAASGEAALDHTWFRKYSSTQGRWLSPDPLGGTLANPQSLNRYAYVLNNPVNYFDPLGLKCYQVTELSDGSGRETVELPQYTTEQDCTDNGGTWAPDIVVIVTVPEDGVGTVYILPPPLDPPPGPIARSGGGGELEWWGTFAAEALQLWKVSTGPGSCTQVFLDTIKPAADGVKSASGNLKQFAVPATMTVAQLAGSALSSLRANIEPLTRSANAQHPYDPTTYAAVAAAATAAAAGANQLAIGARALAARTPVYALGALDLALAYAVVKEGYAAATGQCKP